MPCAKRGPGLAEAAAAAENAADGAPRGGRVSQVCLRRLRKLVCEERGD
jgi:hypothetical protein